MNIVPNSPETEQAVLGALLIDPEAILRVSPLIKHSDFYMEKHAWIYQAIQHVADSSEPIDFLTVVNELTKSGKLNDVGGAAYITHLVNACGTSLNAESYAKQLASLSGKRRIIGAITQMATVAYDGHDYDSAFALCQSELLKCAPRASGKFVSSDDGVADIITEMRLRFDEPMEVSGVKTGYIDWDRKFGGLQVGLHVIEGRTSSGKTWLSMGIADGAAKHGVTVAFISLEMPAKQINYRRVSRMSGIKINTLRTGYIWIADTKRTLNDDEKEHIIAAADKISNLPVYIASAHDSTSSQLRAMISEMVGRYGVGLAVVDYAQKIMDTGERDELAIGRAAHNLKDCADSLGIPIVLNSQVSRRSSGRDSRFLELEDIRGSGQIGEAADTVYGLSSEDYGKTFDPLYKRKNIVEVSCLKDRLGGGAGKMIQLAVREETGALENMAGEAAQREPLADYTH